MSSALPADAPAAGENIPDYAQFYAEFSADSIAAELSGNLQTGINACVECCDRHATPGHDRIALLWEGKDGRSASYTFAQLKELSGRFANFLKQQGVQPGDRVAGLLPRTPELLVAILGTWRAGAVYQPLFTAFGSKSIEYRVAASEAKLIVTDADNRHKLAEVLDCPPIMTVMTAADATPAGDFGFWPELEQQSSEFAPVMRKADDAFIMLFTSGTTGPAKGVAVPLRAMLAFYVYTRYAMDVRPEDAFWNIADPGWAYGLYYCVTGPMLMGHAITFYEGSFTVESTYRIIDKYKITNLAGSPTAYRLLIAGGAEAAAPVKGQLRAVSSAGEPLNPEVIRWFRQHLACLINDHYGQTETGMVLCNHHGLRHEVHMGSAGLAMPGYRLAVLDDDQNELGVGQPGVLAVDRRHSPVYWFQGYWQQDANDDDYYITGDTVETNQDGSISFIGRGDDIITSSGYRIGPFDVESALLEHAAVMEAAVVGKPDPERTELVKAFVVLSTGYQASAELVAELQQYVKHRLAAHSYPREIEFLTELPKTPSGKLQRFILRNQEIAKAKI
ncbi:MAG: Acetyl-coenzyme synthetase [Collimonas fungivorans]|uniref:AMP-binding protein n=1 Tax=Collimonas fungivorans TaxID=158899 RepID=UPI0026F178F8|nr:AMP-binding protein [Collimonas fungivorans]MDB5766784.1 Acetyl-coenzyme synthetase [Collimonas fungivorans]